ncbi:MAG: hypothetical protein FWF82_01120 [Oscillospiraceae bacterium]|nr:hypothetical protein [Oscillospiraceae bacterium]
MMKSVVKTASSCGVFVLFFLAVLTAVGLVSAGLLAIPVSIVAMSGRFTNIARIVSDLSPAAMFFAGVSALSAGLALSLAILHLFPKQPGWFTRGERASGGKLF